MSRQEFLEEAEFQASLTASTCSIGPRDVIIELMQKAYTCLSDKYMRDPKHAKIYLQSAYILAQHLSPSDHMLVLSIAALINEI